MPDLVALAQLGGFATLGIIMTYAANKIFTAWSKGDLVARSVYERSEARADLLAGQLERNTEALRTMSDLQAKQAAAVEKLAAAVERKARREGKVP